MTYDASIVAPKQRFAPWLLDPMRRNKAIYLKVALAATTINLLGLVSSLFTMTVYDRVVPNNATSSLIGLSIGLGIVIVFDFILRLLRGYFVDVAGAQIDHEVGETLFAKLLAIRLDKRKGSTGSLTGVMRELETLRDFFASATITAIVDVPFIVITLALIAVIGGPVVWVPLAMVPLVVLVGVLTHPAMDRLSTRSMGDGLLKQSVLVETIGSLETVKASGAGGMLANRWRKAVNQHADSSLGQRLISTIAVTTATSANTMSYAGVVIVG
ncbi:MAG: type I secretion system permease/ATPase, partial [Oxalobacteraceae bacterium]